MAVMGKSFGLSPPPPPFSCFFSFQVACNTCEYQRTTTDTQDLRPAPSHEPKPKPPLQLLKPARRNARSDPPPHRRWRRVLDSKSKSSPNTYQAQDAQLPKPRPRSPDLPPLYYLSPGPRTFRRAGSKSPADLRQTLFFSIFWPSGTRFENDFEKTWKKMRKSMFLASQNHPQILPKRLRKRCPNKHGIFHRFWLEFCCLLQEPNLKIRAPTQCFVNF